VFTEYAEQEIVRDIKEKLCYVPLDFNEEYAKDPKEVEVDYVMPDKQVLFFHFSLFLFVFVSLSHTHTSTYTYTLSFYCS
jgi:hypothetical protein